MPAGQDQDPPAGADAPERERGGAIRVWLLCVKTHKTHYAAARIMSRAATRVLIVAVCEITASHNPERSMLLEPGWTRGRRQQ